MGENNIFVDKEKVAGYIVDLNALVSDKLISDKLEEIDELLSGNLGNTAEALSRISSALYSIEETMSSLISATSFMLDSVNLAYEDADTAEMNF